MTESDDEFININDLINNKSIKENKDQNYIFNNYSNFSEVIRENKDLDTDKYLYQPECKFNDNTCEFKIVGLSDDKKPDIKIGEFSFLNNKIVIIGHIYTFNEIYDKKYIDIITLKINKINKNYYITFRFNILEKTKEEIKKEKEVIENKKEVNKGDFDIIFTYKENNNNKTIKLKKMTNYPGHDKVIEKLIKELSNPNIIDIYDEND